MLFGVKLRSGSHPPWVSKYVPYELLKQTISAGRVQAITGAILSYSSSASAPNLDPIAFKEAALARLRNVAVPYHRNRPFQ